MNYSETLDYLFAALPMYQRIGAAAYKADLDNTIALCNALGNPQSKFKSIHVAGTNGKGSSSHMLAAILQSAGYKTGLYTSPHLKDFTERIRINGEPVTEKYVVSFVEGIRPVLDKIQPSFFETTVAMAFDYFAGEAVDIAVIEVGLGGRLDSTNVITPLVSLITNISFDHKNLLGDTLPKIAFEKAGIIKRMVPAVVSQRQSDTDEVFITKAREQAAPLTFGADVYSLTEKNGFFDVVKDDKLIIEDLECGLKGFYQRKNIPGVLTVVDRIRADGFIISEEAVRKGIKEVAELTGLKGRWQKLQDHPLIICDIGHNEDGIREVLLNIDKTPHVRLHIVFGMVNDKDITSAVQQLPRNAAYYFCEAKIPRAMPAEELAGKAYDLLGVRGEVIPDVNDAIRKAKAKADRNDMIFIGGSTFVVAEIEDL